MSQQHGMDDESSEGGIVIPFPTNRTTPPRLPRLPRAIPTPGSGAFAVGSAPLFGSALTRRFDRDAA